MDRTDGERLAALETDMKTVKRDVGETKGDVKILLAYFNAQQGLISGVQRIAPWVAIIVSVAVAVRAS